ncbi:helix-turn-helix domain-containing protein [Pontivivens ytuae]|uniref:Helix-turn-helix transcriptional regulator n=1 Tax=Pontivivens ytuae TaxID=2789856 RepID=A0A7S9LQF0_9RHOB|nr:AraC family transcriptional regulator [Pontivivens ytuae]QPH53322.1 helix-turn-helix transcriptional regulator [Pontivivens ytuae]
MDGLTSAPLALDFAFRPHARTVVERCGRVEERPIRALTGGAVGVEPVQFLETDGPSEFVEVRPAPWLRQEVVEDLRAADVAEHERVWNRADPALFALAVRVRADALGGPRLASLELEHLTRNALARSLEAVGARPRPRTVRGLDARRLTRVTEFIDTNLGSDLRLGELADVAAVSRHHFGRMFALAVGATPHAFVAARRVQRAAEAIRAGARVAQAAVHVGYAPGHSFRTAFAAQFGRTPRRYAQVAGHSVGSFSRSC